MKILIVDHEYETINLIKLYLTNENYEMIEALSAEDALTKINHNVDLIIMDIDLPDTDGFRLCSTIRESFAMPIIFLTARNEELDRLTAFTLGADDYITKPFNPMDLLMRVKSNVRRYREYSNPTYNPPNTVVYGELTLNINSHTAHKDNIPLKLTKKEFSILYLLIKNRGRVFSLKQIYENVWGEDSILNTESTVSVHIRNIREKIENDVSSPQYIKTVWGVGYRVD